jgi:hypothetical protein
MIPTLGCHRAHLPLIGVPQSFVLALSLTPCDPCGIGWLAAEVHLFDFQERRAVTSRR